jgi:hypothetical protein
MDANAASRPDRRTRFPPPFATSRNDPKIGLPGHVRRCGDEPAETAIHVIIAVERRYSSMLFVLRRIAYFPDGAAGGARAMAALQRDNVSTRAMALVVTPRRMAL